MANVFWGICLIVQNYFYPDKITDYERNYPKSQIAIIGVSASLNGILFLIIFYLFNLFLNLF
jgi:hypothetical protein